MTTNNFQKLAFLDTNALGNLFTFWEACHLAQISMSSVLDWKELQSALSSATSAAVSELNERDFGPIAIGLSCFKSLDRAKENYDYLCCHINRSELHYVLLTSIASEELYRRRVPFSLTNRRPLIVHQIALPDDAYSSTEDKIEEFFISMNNDHGIGINVVEDSTRTNYISSEEVFETAKKVWSHVLMETMDAYIFAAAIAAEAECVITSDHALLTTINGLREGQREWQRVASALKIALGKEQPFSFPRGMRPSGTLP